MSRRMMPRSRRRSPCQLQPAPRARVLRLARAPLVALLIGLTLAALAAAPALAQGRQAVAASAPAPAAHALPTHYYPEPNAVLKTPPNHVQITFSELLNHDLSKIVVVDPSNREVDNHDSTISADDYTINVTLPLLPAGTYVVFWRTHSAQDGHIASGSYLFHIARADGTVPPFTGPLPKGTFAGGAGVTPAALDGPTLIGGLARWVALLVITLLLGMIFWVIVVQPRQPALSDTLRAASQRQMWRAANVGLWVLLGATLVEVGAQAWLLEGSWSALVSPTLLESILLSSRFGEAISLRMALTVIGLIVVGLSAPRPAGSAKETIFDPRVALVAFGAALALAYEYSGHGASTTLWWEPVVDFLHLIANGVWLGGLLTLAVVLVPALRAVAPAERRAYVASSIPAFSIPALVAVALLVVTGPLNATARLLSISQLWTTAYGVTLDIKSALFLVMVALSYTHAFALRPALSDSADVESKASRLKWVAPINQRIQQLAISALGRATPAASVRHAGVAAAEHEAASGAMAAARAGSEPRALIERAITRAWRIEAAVGVGVLLCAALMGPLAGTLEVTPATSASFGATGGTQTITQQVDGLSVTMNVNPGKFGTNTFTVTVKNPNGQPASGASVFIVADMVEMDMGENTINLSATQTPGVYSGQGELSMAGHWKLRTVIRTKEDPDHLHTTTFTVSASF